MAQTRFTVTWPNRPLGLQRQHGDDDDQRHGQLLAVADEIDARRSLEHVAEVGEHVLEHADDEAADHRAARAGDAADQRAGKAVEQDARHHVGVEIDGRRDHHAGHRADRRGKAPAQRQHPVDADAGEARRVGVLRRGAHGEARAA